MVVEPDLLFFCTNDKEIYEDRLAGGGLHFFLYPFVHALVLYLAGCSMSLNKESLGSNPQTPEHEAEGELD